MTLPALTHWTNTRLGLQRAAQVTARIKKALIAPQINSLHLGQYVDAHGLTTGRLNNGGEFKLNFGQAAVDYYMPNGQRVGIVLHNLTQRRLLEALQFYLPDVEINVPNLSDEEFLVDEVIAAEYARALNVIYNGIARFRGRLLGTMTPIVVWEHGFDLSMLWFRGNSPDEHNEPHINVGFSPGSPGFDEPYLYAYASPSPADLAARKLPAPAYWYTDKWKGAVTPYSAIRQAEDPTTFVEEMARAMYHALL